MKVPQTKRRAAASIVAGFGLLFQIHVAIADQSATEIIAKVDEIRNPQIDYRATVKITSVRPDETPRESSYELMIKGRERAIIKGLEPASNRGRILLMKALDLWAYLPNLSQPLRISLRERLMGEASNADVARANLSGDYDAALDGEDVIEGRTYKRLVLKAKSPEVPYGGVRLWVASESLYPYRAEFYGPSGKILKRCTYDRFREMEGTIRPTRIILFDPLNQNQRTTIDYESMHAEPLPDKYFNDDYLKKLS